MVQQILRKQNHYSHMSVTLDLCHNCWTTVYTCKNGFTNKMSDKVKNEKKSIN